MDKKGARSMSKEKEGGFLAELVKVLVQAFVIALVVRTILFQPFNIPSGSMIPTLLIGDYLFVSKYAYGYSNHSLPFSPNLFPGRIFASPPKRGDVVVFKFPRDNQQDYIKRVIGLPGDKIQMKDGRLYINGELVPREPIKRLEEKDMLGRVREVPTYRETLPGGVSHTIVEVEGDNGPYDNTGVYEVPPDHYFMMGDNRDDSADSRDPTSGVGFVPAENIVGPAQFIFFSTSASLFEPWTWPFGIRFSRLLMGIH